MIGEDQAPGMQRHDAPAPLTFRRGFCASLALSPLTGSLSFALLVLSSSYGFFYFLRNLFWLPALLPFLLPLLGASYRRAGPLLGVVAGLLLTMAGFALLFILAMAYALTRNEWH